jgi:XTP/dITP diphosphohydrolase
MREKSTQSLSPIYLVTSNPGKIRDFQGAARNLGIAVEPLPGFSAFPQAVENGATFEENARIKAEHYSRLAPGKLVVADDSGLAVDALEGAPGVHSARYAAMLAGTGGHLNSDDQENNAALIARLKEVPESRRAGKFVCVIAVAKDGKVLNTFYGDVQGRLLTAPQGDNGFGYDPLFYFPELGVTFAELTAEQKALYSHRGKAFRKFLEWYRTAPHEAP